MNQYTKSLNTVLDRFELSINTAELRTDNKFSIAYNKVIKKFFLSNIVGRTSGHRLDNKALMALLSELSKTVQPSVTVFEKRLGNEDVRQVESYGHVKFLNGEMLLTISDDKAESKYVDEIFSYHDFDTFKVNADNEYVIRTKLNHIGISSFDNYEIKNIEKYEYFFIVINFPLEF